MSDETQDKDVPTGADSVDAEKAAGSGITNAPARVEDAKEIEEHGMDAEAIEAKASKQNEDVKAALDDGAKFIQHPNSPAQPGVNDSGKYVRSTKQDERTAREDEQREGTADDGTGQAKGEDKYGRNFKGRVKRDRALDDKLIDSMSAADLQAVAADRGYDLALSAGKNSTAAAFRKAQSDDKMIANKE